MKKPKKKEVTNNINLFKPDVKSSRIGRINFENFDLHSNVSFWLIPNYRHNGIMKQVLNISLKDLFENDKIKSCSAFGIKVNKDIYKFLTVFGFTHIEKQNSNLNQFTITSEDFKKL